MYDEGRRAAHGGIREPSAATVPTGSTTSSSGPPPPA
ncbi:hypothetical protein GA0115253_105543, partial [Streptomyces sp. Termitarium-T10T-6]